MSTDASRGRYLACALLCAGVILCLPASAQDRPPHAQGLVQGSECDDFAAAPYDSNRPSGISGIEIDQINTSKAVPACRAALASHPGDPRFEFQLGRALEAKGDSVSIIEAARHYQIAADHSYLAAMVNLGTLYEFGRAGGTAETAAKAMELFKLAAEKGDARAQTRLGALYAGADPSFTHGFIKTDDVEAARLLKLAAAQGYYLAQYNLGTFYASGRGDVGKNEVEAARLFKLAADQGYAAAQYNLGHYYEHGQGGLGNDLKEATRLYKLASDQDDRYAAHSLVRLYMDGRDSQWITRQADSGDPEAQYYVGMDYYFGDPTVVVHLPSGATMEGTTRDYVEAGKWFQRAAAQGYVDAQFRLGRMYAKAIGMTYNIIDAYMWLSLSASQGNKSAAEYRDRLAYQMTAAEIAEAERLASGWKRSTK
jgi:TPR repeat protein